MLTNIPYLTIYICVQPWNLIIRLNISENICWILSIPLQQVVNKNVVKKIKQSKNCKI